MVFSFRQLPNVDAARGRRLRPGDPDRQAEFLETQWAKEARTRVQK